MQTFTGTVALLRLALRRDRIKLPLWIAGIVILLATVVAANASLYHTEPERMVYATTSAVSMVSRILGGPISGSSLASILMVESFQFTAVAVAFMSTLTVIRHTRQNEETGRSEMIRAAIVSHNAPLAAALIVAIGSSVVVGILSTITLKLVVSELPITGAIAYGAVMACIGIAFAAVAAVTAQLTQGARTANGLAATAIGVAFLLRSFGDVLGKVSSNGQEVISSWLTWTSPLGWGFLVQPFVHDRWWVLGLFLAFSALLITAAFFMVDYRDDGSGMIEPRKGPAHAKQWLLSPFGLAWRLQRGTFIGWAVATSIVGVGFGAAGKEFSNMFKDNPELSRVMGVTGTGDVIKYMFAFLLIYSGFIVSCYAIQTLLRLRAEENGTLELLLATGVSRQKWMASHIVIAVIGSVIMVVSSGLLMAVTYGLATGDMNSSFSGIMKGALVQIPAILVIIGFVIALFALLPRLVIALGWLTVVAVFVIKQFGIVLEFPQWVMNISPFTHLPNVPVTGVEFTPLLILLCVAAAMAAAGFVVFRIRDISVS